MLWRASGLSSLEDYLDSSLGIQKSLFPTVLGLKLAEDLDLGKRFEPCDHTRRFPFNQNSGTLEKGKNDAEIALESFRKIRQLLNFRMRNIQQKI